MKIAVIVSLYPKLSETFILDQIIGLLNHGHEVTVIAGINPNEEKVHKNYFKYNLKAISYWLPNKFWRYLKAFYLIIRYFPHEPILLLKSLNFIKYGRDALSLRLFYCLIPILKKGPFDVLHCHFGENGRVGAMLKEMGVSGKLTVVFHGSDITARIQRSGADFYNSLFREADLLLPVCDSFKRRLLELNAPSKKIIVHRVGIDSEKFRFQHRNYDAKEPLKILTIARLVEKKGLEYSIRTVTNLIKKHSEISIVYNIIGEGPLAEKLTKLIHDLQVENNIFLLGALEQESILEWILKSHIYVLASVTAINGDQESCPVSLKEAMATGMPVVSTWHSGIPELIENGNSGLLVQERNVESLGSAIEKLMLNPQKWSRFGKAARDAVLKDYDNRKLNLQLSKMLNQLMKANTTSSTTRPQRFNREAELTP